MQDASYAEVRTSVRASELSAATKLAMVIIGYVPLLHVVATIAAAFAPLPAPTRAALALFVFFLAPPLASRLVGLRAGTFRAGDSGFLRWWLTNQLQTIFNRLPIDEIVRLVPGAYSLWLRLWGARVGSLVYWSPRSLILDRSLLHVGDAVVIGAGARLGGHLLTRGEDGDLQLVVAPITIRARAIVGAWSLIGPGCEIAEGESVTASTVLPPFWTWSGGRRRARDHAR